LNPKGPYYIFYLRKSTTVTGYHVAAEDYLLVENKMDSLWNRLIVFWKVSEFVYLIVRNAQK